MYKPFAMVLAALVFTVTTATAQTTTIDASGRVVRVDPNAQVIILDNNQAFRVGPNTVLLVDNRPVRFSSLQPGQTDADTFKLKVPREVAAQLREGDSVRLDVSFQPAR